MRATTWISAFPYLASMAMETHVEMEPVSSWFPSMWSAESLCYPVINAENQRGIDMVVSPSNIQDVIAAGAQLILTNPPLRCGQLSLPPTHSPKVQTRDPGLSKQIGVSLFTGRSDRLRHGRVTGLDP